MTWLDALGWAGSVLLIVSLLQARVLRFRVLNTIASVVLVVFNALLGIWPMVAMNAVLAGINLWFIRSLLAHRHDERTYRVIEVSTRDGWLNYLIERHLDDIRHFQPGFRWHPDDERAAFLVVRDDEAVGIVLARDLGDGVAQIDLDYVTPRFRDFTPGEFVFRRSGLFRDLGFRKVMTPPGMVDPYYESVGFSREGESYALTVE